MRPEGPEVGGGTRSPVERPHEARQHDGSRARNIGLGCFTSFIGFWSGGMIGVLLGKFVGSARGCVPLEGLPACDWYLYAAGGMAVGATTLPVLALRRLRRRDAAARTST